MVENLQSLVLTVLELLPSPAVPLFHPGCLGDVHLFRQGSVAAGQIRLGEPLPQPLCVKIPVIIRFSRLGLCAPGAVAGPAAGANL